MAQENNQLKTVLHPRNKNRERYDLGALLIAEPQLASHIKPNKYGADSVDFSNPIAVKLLNKALLKHYYGIQQWDFPDKNLCPPVPGRADYIHYMADLLKESNFGRLPEGDKITVLDVGTGASCIYPIIGAAEYDWRFIASDVNKKSVGSAQSIANANPQLNGRIDCRIQNNPRHFFEGILAVDEKVDVVICNPPFHASREEAQSGTQRKIKNLSGEKENTVELNFGGTYNELIYEGGESKFINDMVYESRRFAKQCFWFSTLVSKQSNLKGIYKTLDKVGTIEVKTINMATGNKSTRIVAWSFLDKEGQKQWRDTRWNSKS